MKRFFEFQQAFALIALTGFLALGTLSCDKDDDDDSTGSGAAVFKFKGGVNSTNTTVTDLKGDEKFTPSGSGSNSGVSTLNLPHVVNVGSDSDTSNDTSPPYKLCSFFLKKSGFPPSPFGRRKKRKEPKLLQLRRQPILRELQTIL